MMTRKAFVNLLDAIDQQRPSKSRRRPLTDFFYEMIEPLDTEVAQLRAEVAKLNKELTKLGKELDLQLEGNKNLYDQFTMMLDGARPPSGVRTTVEALEPFARLAEDVVGMADRMGVTDDAGVTINARGFITLEPIDGLLTVGYFRDAAATLAWVKSVKELRKSTEQKERRKAERR